LQAQKNKTAELPEDKRLLVEDKERWGKMLQRAEGGKVRDDETRLKKAERRMEKQKAKSGKEWYVRLDAKKTRNGGLTAALRMLIGAIGVSANGKRIIRRLSRQKSGTKISQTGAKPRRTRSSV
jgi:hypothetical protein